MKCQVITESPPHNLYSCGEDFRSVSVGCSATKSRMMDAKHNCPQQKSVASKTEGVFETSAVKSLSDYDNNSVTSCRQLSV